jgi:hypothetical protein
MKYDNIDIEDYNKSIIDEDKKLKLCHCGKKYISWNFNQHTKTKHHLKYKQDNRECYFYDNIQYKMFDYISRCKNPSCEFFELKDKCSKEHYKSNIDVIILDDKIDNDIKVFHK